MIIHKLDYANRETWRYTGKILERGTTWVCIEAYFNRDDSDDGYVIWRRGDRFVEWFYTDRWYNIFEIHDVFEDRLKGWYCNLTRPTIIDADDIYWSDLALDLWIDPSGQVQLLDESELATLPIDIATREQIWQAVAELHARIERRESPFQHI